MVLLTVTAAAKAAVEACRILKSESAPGMNSEMQARLSHLSALEVGSPIDHDDLIKLSNLLTNNSFSQTRQDGNWRLDSLLKGASVYRPPPPTKAEPTAEFKALMQRLRHEEEQRQYERMINPQPQPETFGQRFPSAAQRFNPATSIGQGPDTKEVDDVTFADVNRQMALIINVLVSIIACSVAIWIAARRWSVPQRLGLSMSGSCLVAVAEVAIYMGYIRRIKDARDKERKVVESKEIVESWVLDGVSGRDKAVSADAVRYRKGKHR